MAACLRPGPVPPAARVRPDRRSRRHSPHSGDPGWPRHLCGGVSGRSRGTSRTRNASCATTRKTGPAATPPKPAVPWVPFTVSYYYDSGICDGRKSHERGVVGMRIVPGGVIVDLGGAGLSAAGIAVQPGRTMAGARGNTTTPSIIRRMVMAVSGCKTRRGGSAGAGCSPLRRTIRGRTSNPPLATTEQARANCSVVTLTSWPMATEGREVACQRSSLRSMPAIQPAG